jgi:hypothetical protein
VNSWVRPTNDQAGQWADFLDSLIWPTKNRYVIAYNEPNQGLEWGGEVDATSYARSLDNLISNLKSKSDDFYVLNAGFDASAPEKIPAYEDEDVFLREMEQAVPGIFNRLDGWVSHSYPNPDYSGSPSDSGRGSIQTWQWEMDELKKFGVDKKLPIFITETGWKHAEGPDYNPNYVSAEKAADFYNQAFTKFWNNSQIVVVTPFVLDYQGDPFQHFSFKKPSSKISDKAVEASASAAFYPMYQTIADMPKTKAQPVQENKADLTESNFYNNVALNESYTISVKVKNTGQSIWGEKGQVRLAPEGSTELGIGSVAIPEGTKIEPGQEFNFVTTIKPTELGDFSGSLVLYNGNDKFSSDPFTFSTTVKSPVLLKIKTKLAWKDSSAGDYILSWLDGIHEVAQKVILGQNNESDNISGHTILPDAGYNFTLSKPYYKPKTIYQTVHSGDNDLDFGELQPDLPSAILNPPQLLQLLPGSH